MTIHVLVEGPSERVLLERWATRLMRDAEVRVHPHQGKGTLPAKVGMRPDPSRRGLLDQLPAKLRGFSSSLKPLTDAVMVLVDADDDDPADLARSIEAVAKKVAPNLSVVVRLAVEETEAFYLGDLNALARTFPEADLRAARRYQADSICGTWELFGRIVGDGGGNKVAWAEAMGPALTVRPAKSRSPSFRGLISGLLSLVSPAARRTKVRAYRHLPKKRRASGGRR